MKYIKKTYIGNELKVYKCTIKLTDLQRDIIIGTLLGDASMSLRKGVPWYGLKFEQKEGSASYINHLYEILEPFVGMVPTIRLIKASGKFKERKSIWFRTYRHDSFKFYFDLFYNVEEGKLIKKLPNNLHKYLNERVLAYWFMDDGNILKSGYMLNTQSYMLKEHEYLVDIFLEKFGVYTSIHKDKNKYRLYIRSGSVKVFTDLILPYIHKCFEYKLHKI